MNENLVTGFNHSLLMLTLRLSAAMYIKGQLEQEPVEILYYSKNNYRHFPVFAICRKNDSLFIVVRGSSSEVDWETNFNFTQTYHTVMDSNISFHAGFYYSAYNILSVIEDIFEEHDGPIYFTGHSLGASVASCLCALAISQYPDKDFNAIAFGAAPSMGPLPFAISSKIVSVIMSSDIVPTLSVANAHDTFYHNHDDPKAATKLSKAISKVGSLMELTFTDFFTSLGKILTKKAYEIGNTILDFEPDERNVHYPSGNIYRLRSSTKSVRLEKVTTNVFGKININVISFVYHGPSVYLLALSKINDNDISSLIANETQTFEEL